MRKRLALFCVFLLVLGSSSFALNLNDLIRGAIQEGVRQAVLSEWRKLPTSEIACIDRNLHQQGLSIDSIGSWGIEPSDPRLAQLRASCRKQFVQTPSQFGSAQQSPYIVDGLALGSQVQFGSQAYQRYQCGPSDKFSGFIWCHEEHKTKERGNEITHSHSILHSQDGTAFYVNAYIEPAFFGRNDIQGEINRLSSKFGQQARIIQMPQREGLSSATMAVWGAIQLEPLRPAEISVVASGGGHSGLLVSFLGDLQRSAKAGIPVYRLSGGAGYLWVATYNPNGRGVLRYLEIDASKIEASNQVASNQPSPAHPNSPTPSFDCAKARAPDEFAICSSVELSELDKAVARGFEYVRAANGDLVARQINTPLFRARQACGSDVSCIKEKQIAALNAYQNYGAPVKVSLWNYNGSKMLLIANGRLRKFFYEVPSPEMASAGARSGSISFDGQTIDQQYVGSAYLYNSTCGQITYQVSGPILDDYERVVLQGAAPRFGPNCAPQGYATASLEFRLDTGTPTASSEIQPVPSPKETTQTQSPPSPKETTQTQSLPSPKETTQTQSPPSPTETTQTQSPPAPSSNADATPRRAPEQTAQRPRCDTLTTSKPYFVAECIAVGMDRARYLHGLSDAKVAAKREYDGLADCTPSSLSQLQQMATVGATKILNSGAISKLMDFHDAIRLECNKAADLIFNASTSQGN
jgi:uncharacterized protein